METLVAKPIEPPPFGHEIFDGVNPQTAFCWYDGPLSFKFEKDGRTYLVHWVDCTEDHSIQRYMVYPVPPAPEGELSPVLDNGVTLRHFMLTAPKCWAVDIFVAGERVYELYPLDLPEDYLPYEHTYLRDDEIGDADTVVE